MSDKSKKARRAIVSARTKMLGTQGPRRGLVACFFGALAMRLDIVEDTGIDTAATDGRRLLYNPDFMLSLSSDEVMFVVAHEVLHCALLHFARRQQREPMRWNIAADLALNPLLVEGGMKMPAKCLLPGNTPFSSFPRGKSAEEYYAMLPEKLQQLLPFGGDSKDPGGCGGVIDPPQGADSPSIEEQAAVWKQIAEAAMKEAKKAGNLPASFERLVSEVLLPKVPWSSVLREFVSRFARNDFCWARPNRRFISQGLYLPGLRSEELGRVVCCVDTSGSIGQRQLNRFASELQGVLDAYDCELVVLYHDKQVAGVQEWKSSDGPLRLEAKGGGGTSHVEVLARASDYDPTVVLALTDCYTNYPPKAPSYPLLFVVVNNPSPHIPFGRMLIVEE